MKIKGLPNKPVNIGGINKVPNKIKGMNKIPDVNKLNDFSKVKTEKNLSKKIMNNQGENVIRNNMM